MNIDINVNIYEKPKAKNNENIQASSPEIIVGLEDVKKIRNAIREYLIFVGMDNHNNVRTVEVLGMGASNHVIVDTKEIIRTALFNACDKVALVHNHPSNSLKPSKEDIYLTDMARGILDVFNIELVDHIIVTTNEYVSMTREKIHGNSYIYDDIEKMDKGLLFEENTKLKIEIAELKKLLEKNKEQEDELEM